MNANELADELENTTRHRNETLFVDAANMLRQQQAQIEALNQRIERMIENQSHHEGIAHAGGFEAGFQEAQAKTLTDEEIANTWDDVRKDATLKSSMKDIQDFAKAILRKAQEK